MKKIGIMSMQRIKNYGSFLQAYALKSIIEDLGYEVEFVDYHKGLPLVKNNTFRISSFLKEDMSVIQKLQYIKHKKNFNKYLKLLKINNNYNYNAKVDTLVIGSDEVFNCIQSNPNVGYSLELFGQNNNSKKLISYAASFGNTTLEKLYEYYINDEVGELLKKFDCISVRDINSFKIVKQLTKKEPLINLDPVLVYDYMDEAKIVPINVKEKYMIIYAYKGRISSKEREQIRKFAKAKNLKIYALASPQKCADKFIDCSPFQVLSYFKNAEYIITDTFHGTIFSIIANKKFISLIRKSNDNFYGNEEKLAFLLKELNLEDRSGFDIENLINILNEDIDYNPINNFIQNERKKTIEYLKSNL
jgi:polysaccharide pyruvyl transferase WcaK-like protein